MSRARVRVVLSALPLLLLTGCGGDDSPATSALTSTPIVATTSEAVEVPTAPDQTRPFEHALGTTEIPVEPMRIVTLQDQNALLPLLELGVKPVASAGRLADDGTGTFRRVDGFDTSGIAFIGDFLEPHLEAIAAQRPDLIVGDEFSIEEENYDQLSAIAPTVAVQVFDRPLTEALADFADLVGREERAAQLLSAYDERIAELRGALGADLDRTTVSILAADEPGTFYPESVDFTAQGTVMKALELRRPEVNLPAESESLSLESLSAQDADAVLVCDYGGEEADPGSEALVASRLYARLAAAKAEQAVVIDCTRSVGASWGKMEVFLDELERILLADDFDHDVVEETP